MPEQGHLTVTLPQGNTVAGQGYSSDIVGSGGHKFDLYVDELRYEAQPPYRNIVLDQGEVDYQSVNPEQGVAWNMVEDLSRGAGTFHAGRGRFNNGKYSMAENFDAEYLCQGPRQVNEYPGIPFGVTPVGYYDKMPGYEFVWTDSADYALFRRASGTHHWRYIGGQAPGTINGSTTGNCWSSLVSSTVVKCVAHLGTTFMVGFGENVKYVRTTDVTTNPVTWAATAETTIPAAEYANVAVGVTYKLSTGSAEQCIIYMGQTGKLYKTPDLSLDSAVGGAAVLANGAAIGNSSGDTANSIVMADGNTIIFVGKDSGLYDIDTAGNIGESLSKRYPSVGTTDSAGYSAANFRQVVTLGNGYMYWLVGNYTLVEREPVNGTFTEFTIKDWGPQTPRFQLPILAICAGPDNKLYAALGTNNSGLLDLSTFAGGTQLLANTVTTGTTYIAKGFGKAHNSDWVWHMSLGSISQLATLMFYNETIQRLFVGLYTDSTDRTGMYMRYTQNNGSSYTNEDDVVQGTGTAAITALDTVANGDWILIGFSRPFTSLAVALSTANTNIRSVTVSYSTGAGTWSNVSNMLDGTSATTNVTLGRTGVIAWDLPTVGAGGWVTADYDGVTGKYWVRLSVSAALTNITISNILPGYSENQRQFVVVPGNPIMKKDAGPYDSGTGTVKVTTSTAKLETGKFHDQRPLDGKAGRFFNAITQNLSAAGTLAVKYRTASDASTSSGYTTQATYTSDALALTGTAMTYDATNPPSFTEGIRFLLELAPHASNTALRLEAALFRFVNASVAGVGRKRKLVVVLSEVVDGPMTRQGHRARTSLKETITNLEAWRDAINPVATVVDNDLGLSMNMVLADFEPRFGGKEKNWQVAVTMVEVV